MCKERKANEPEPNRNDTVDVDLDLTGFALLCFPFFFLLLDTPLLLLLPLPVRNREKKTVCVRLPPHLRPTHKSTHSTNSLYNTKPFFSFFILPSQSPLFTS
jgi:hypothetical protein